MHIKSKLKACAVAVALANVPFAVNAAGLGRLNVLSGLGQPLRAEIDLVAIQPGEAESLKASLASPEAYKDAQIEYPSSSLGLRFSIEKRASGQYYVAVKSNQSVNEPFIDVLVELKWEGGRVLREYSALLDPVGYTPGKSAEAPVSPVVSNQKKTGETNKEMPPASKPAPEPQASSDLLEGDSHEVKAGESLSSIARKFQPEGISLEQMLVGLYRANPDAFDGKNMNRLRKGKILKIPGKETLAEVTKPAAAKEIRVQSENWRSYRGKLADMVSKSGASEQEKNAGAGKITAKVEDKAAAESQPGKGSLKVSKDEAGTKSLKDKIRSLEEEAVARQKALDESKQRVSELEKNVSKMQQLMELKSQKGADMQSHAQAKPEQKAEAKPETKKPEQVKPTEPAKAEAKPATTEKPAAVEAKPEAKPVEPTPPAVKPADAAGDHKPTDAATAQPAVTEPPPAPAAQPPKPKKPKIVAPPPEPEESLLDNPLVLGGGALVGLGGIGGLVMWLLRRRKRNTFDDSIITGSDLKSNTVLGNTGGAVISTGVTENSFLTDFSREGLGTIDTDEVDPIAEAEVYMAYGRDAQAEEILKDALAKDAGRHEVRLKLLEIYSMRKNASAFEALATDLHTATKGSGPVWAQAAEMGRALDPQNQLYSQSAAADSAPSLDKTVVLGVGAAGVAAAAAVGMGQTTKMASSPVAAAVAEAGSDLDFELDFAAGNGSQAAAAVPAASDLDFDLGAGGLDMPASAELDVPQAMPELDVSMDFGDSAMSNPPSLTEEASAGDGAGMLSLDIPLDMGSASAPAVPSLDESLDLSMPDLDLGGGAELSQADDASLDFNFDLGADAAPASATAGGAADLNLDLGMPIEEVSGDDMSMDFGGDLDDPVTTKIDLARAYIDMGDKEGAKEILQEALSEGNPEQKATAQSLLAGL
ncbi:FimV/HubP family polar landmark protein [Parachitinimonas caeni]|uniref:FimV/HubP family polar landmark protein n=1 Tax=Parachitinimonas caeni TaxID=3031301 RepID=A0ABT7E1I4_9NEIS|nr:FimV/HubP family polar landmark protein [Parachitinimonas caeni]MDK2126183.1 FimV/HubP family polar landmark protein [Parachitinimonas caeni]